MMAHTKSDCYCFSFKYKITLGFLFAAIGSVRNRIENGIQTHKYSIGHIVRIKQLKFPLRFVKAKNRIVYEI